MSSTEISIQALPKATVRLIGSAQVITSVNSVIKELVENSLDAGATTVDIKLENFGFDKIEVRDNGCGIRASDTENMGRPHYTSKISHTEDLSRLHTYGFRGEALGSLCAVSCTSITTKTSEDDVGMTYDLDKDGTVIEKKPSHLGNGTSVVVTKLFNDIPVRKQFYSATKRRKEELKKVEDLVIAFSIIKHNVRFSLRHNREVLWQSTSVTSPRHVLLKVFGTSVMNLMVHSEKKAVEEGECQIELFVPKPEADSHVTSRALSDRCFVFVNQRPVTHKEITKVLKQHYCQATGCESSRWPLAFVSLQVPPESLDVNLEPNKTRVLLQESVNAVSQLGQMLDEIYGKKEDPVEGGVSIGNCHGDPQVNGQATHTLNGNDANARKYGESEPNRAEHEEKTRNADVTTDFGDISCNSSLHLTAPNHNSTRCDGVQAGPSAEEATFDIGEELNDSADDDLFRGILDDMEKSVTKSDESVQSPSDVTTPTMSHHLSCTAGCVEDKTPPELPSLPADMVREVGNNGDGAVNTVVARTVSLQEESDNEAATRWSHGRAVKDATGKLLEPVQLLLPQSSSLRLEAAQTKVQRRDSLSNTSMSRMSDAANSPGQMKLTDVAGLEHIKKPTTAFIFYSKEIRPRIVKENPDASFQDIARIIGERWKNLCPEDKQEYEKRMTEDVERYREQVAAKKRVLSPCDSSATKKRKLNESTKAMFERLQSPKTSKPEQAKKKSKPFRRITTTVKFSLSEIKTKLTEVDEYSMPYSADQVQIIGEVRPAAWWACIYKGHVVGLAPWRLQEVLIYEQLMETHSLPTEKLDNPLPLTPSLFGSDMLWQTLLSLTCTSAGPSDTYVYITDIRVTRNGFIIRKTQEHCPRVEVISMGTVAQCSTGDLCEIMGHLHQNRGLTVTSSRPFKVKQYLQAEAVRMCRQMPQRVCKQEVQDLLRRMCKRVSSREKTMTCFHNRPYLQELYNLEELPLTQSQQ